MGGSCVANLNFLLQAQASNDEHLALDAEPSVQPTASSDSSAASGDGTDDGSENAGGSENEDAGGPEAEAEVLQQQPADPVVAPNQQRISTAIENASTKLSDIWDTIGRFDEAYRVLTDAAEAANRAQPTVAQVTAQLQAEQQRSSVLQRELTASQEQQAALQVQLTDSAQEKTTVQQQLVGYQQQVAPLQQQLQASQQSQRSAETALSTVRNQLVGVNQQLAGARGELSQAKGRFNDMLSDHAGLKQLYTALFADRERLLQLMHQPAPMTYSPYAMSIPQPAMFPYPADVGYQMGPPQGHQPAAYLPPPGHHRAGGNGGSRGRASARQGYAGQDQQQSAPNRGGQAARRQVPLAPASAAESEAAAVAAQAAVESLNQRLSSRSATADEGQPGQQPAEKRPRVE